MLLPVLRVLLDAHDLLSVCRRSQLDASISYDKSPTPEYWVQPVREVRCVTCAPFPALRTSLLSADSGLCLPHAKSGIVRVRVQLVGPGINIRRAVDLTPLITEAVSRVRARVH